MRIKGVYMEYFEKPYPWAWFDSDANRDLYNQNPEFRAFASKVMSYLETMNYEKRLRLDRYTGQKLEWIVRATVMHIDTHQPREIYFADDFLSIYRVKFYL